MPALDIMLEDYTDLLLMGRYDGSQKDAAILRNMTHEQRLIIMDALSYAFDEGFKEGLRITEDQSATTLE